MNEHIGASEELKTIIYFEEWTKKELKTLRV